MNSCRPFVVALLFVVTFDDRGFAQGWPELPVKDAAVEIPAQEWPQRPGPRAVRVLVCYPNGSLQGVNPQTGIMLTLHNWGGTDCVGTADPRELARRLNVVAVCVNYLQSGKTDSVDGPEPYDFGYLQALDALRALWFVRDGLRSQGKTFRDDRLFCTGGSGGGNVTLMANKLAPRTFACVVDLCGMKKLSDDIAFNLPGGSGLNARWSRDARSKNYLSIDEQELRFVGHPGHLAAMKQLGATSKIVVVHGTDDATCPYADAVEMVDLMKQAGLDVEPKFVTKADLDGAVFTSTGHALGNRTQIVLTAAGKYLAADGENARRRSGPSDFERRESIRYRTTNGEFIISYEAGYPVGRFEPAPPPVEYREHHALLYRLDREGRRHEVRTVEDWQIRRQHIIENLQLAMGPLPSPLSRVPLDVGCIGHSLGGHNAIFTAVFEPRLKAIVSSCGFTNLHKDDIPSWIGPRYMPRLATVFQNDPIRVPFDFHELIGALAPRPFLACAATRDSDFDVAGVRDVMQAARAVYDLHQAAKHLEAAYPDAAHSFPDDARMQAYSFLQRHLAGTTN